ncbi:hypothetical protein BGZ65_004171 [Modicella reniformis]|uniref:Uncharacterized protein n=1 Tax=Modicella reniformis TaxID=1440133 RepID=A0A9P6MH74_9FUNG|nr:hypothetical protein BGZ65_004171 [Modicella reniformis]
MDLQYVYVPDQELCRALFQDPCPIPDYLPRLSPELERLGNILRRQLKALHHILAKYNSSVLCAANEEHRNLHKKFLTHLAWYCDKPLVSLFQSAEKTSKFMKQFNLVFSDFLHYSEHTLQQLQDVLDHMDAVIKQHAATMEKLGDLSRKFEDLFNRCQDVEPKNRNVMEFCAIATGPVAVLVASQTPLLAAACAVPIFFYDRFQATREPRELTRATKVIKEMQIPIGDMESKLLGSKRSLKSLKHYNSNITTNKDVEDIRQIQYEYAQQEARMIDEACQEIQRHAVDFESARSKIESRLGQTRLN